MLRTAATDGTLAYMGFLVLLGTYKLVATRRASRKLRKRIQAWTR